VKRRQLLKRLLQTSSWIVDCWMPSVAGNYTLLARAVSQREQQQLKDENHKDGSTGVLQIQVRLQG